MNLRSKVIIKLLKERVFRMKVQNITDVEGFFKVVDSCKGRVELVTGEETD